MIRVMFITFDYYEKDKPIKSLAVATMESYLKSKVFNIRVDSFSFNMNEVESIVF